ncbi:MAG: cytochrome ubiquinol oxidase subunit I [SAR324 cluster bacterium]|nr:cytochrome ubiquinol oxidase subunit I [SAR324 cluster bacterium]
MLRNFSKFARPFSLLLPVLFYLISSGILCAQELIELPEYRAFPWIGSRVAVWIAAEVHLMFAAFVLGVPMFAVIVELIGVLTREERYDKMAHEFTKLLTVAMSTTAIWGGVLLFLLILLYPRFMNYLSEVFFPTLWIYPLIFFLEAFTLYLYYYGWDRMKSGRSKWFHLYLGLQLNIVGTVLLLVANAWATFMMTPGGVDMKTGAMMNLWEVIDNYAWWPINIHRLIANITFGGAVVAAYAAFKFLHAKGSEERAHYDWMGYVGNMIAIWSFLVLPFAGYWLMRELYEYDQTMGITMMGGFLSWLWIIQAILISSLFLASNYYLWLGMERIDGGERYQKYIKYMLTVLILCVWVWATPHSLVVTPEEVSLMGGVHHPVIGIFGVMSAKMTAVNFMILTSAVGFLFYRRANKVATMSHARFLNWLQAGIFAGVAAYVLYLGVDGYFVEPSIRVNKYSVWQVLAVLFAIVSTTLIDFFLFKGARTIGKFDWGRMPQRSQYTLIFIAISFTWLMGLMGYARSSIRQQWHVYKVMEDTSVDAFAPTLGFAANVVSVCVLIFLGLVMFIFWLGSLGDKKQEKLQTAI